MAKKNNENNTPDYKGMLQKMESIMRDWKKTFAALEKKQNSLLRKIQGARETEQLSKLRRTLS